MARKTAKKKTPLTPAEQSARFIEAARSAGSDETGKKFESAFRTIARSKTKARRQTKA